MIAPLPPVGEVPAQAVDDALTHLNAALHKTLLESGLMTVEQWNAEIAPYLRSIASVVMRSPVHARTYRVHESIYPPKSPPSVRSVSELEKKIAGFALLPDGWDSYGAKAFSMATINLAMEIAKKLGDEWKAVPSGQGSIEFYRGDEEDIIEVWTGDRS